jgi:hypothetical protein
LGENAFFVDVGVRSPHSYINNTCSTCHMVLEDPPAALSYNLGGTNHTFEASTEICSSCHGDFDPAGMMTAFEDMLEELIAALDDGYELALDNAIAAEGLDGVGFCDDFAFVALDELEDSENDAFVQLNTVIFTEEHGQMGVDIAGEDSEGDVIEQHIALRDLRFADDGPDNCGASNDQDCTCGGDVNQNGEYDSQVDDPPEGAYVIEPNSVLSQAGWNYFLLHADGSEGVHNPAFYLDVLNTTLDEVDTWIEANTP